MATKKNKGFISKMRKVFGDWYKGSAFYQSKEHSRVEAELRRHETWRSIKEFTRTLWDEANVGRRMESFLRKRTRAKEDGRLQQAEERAGERNSRLSRLRNSEGFGDLVKFWKQWERTAYVALRHPELRKEGVSLDYYIGFQNGLLSDIEANRKIMQDAQFAILKKEEEDKEKKKREKK